LVYEMGVPRYKERALEGIALIWGPLMVGIGYWMDCTIGSAMRDSRIGSSGSADILPRTGKDTQAACESLPGAP
ncbi:MAG: hypothetical protein V3T78_08045, partial [Dehalococcoidia bacterium]